ncbi:MAG: HTTM domain-containing protein [Bacteroidota bacterium]|nr:HTTM domain-containing protein [Bacteroidota bacterium]
MINKLKNNLLRDVSIAPLVVFRIAFGALMFLSTLRFIMKGWVYDMYIKPEHFFPFYGFEWLSPLSSNGMYAVFCLMLISALFIMTGLFYRISTTLFFLLFTYVELIDKTNYLNHYYFISLVSFLIIFLPAAKAYSLDNLFFKRSSLKSVSNYWIWTIKFQVLIVYFFAGVAKLNYDWLFEAQPLRIWLPAQNHLPVVGGLMDELWVAYFFSWFGCVYDLFIPFLLVRRKTIFIAYFFVIVFHLATRALFNIGMFPYIMIALTVIFFPEEFHKKLLSFLPDLNTHTSTKQYSNSIFKRRIFFYVMGLFFFFQLLMPFRYIAYPGKLFWTEQGFRFSWRVMLMEKAGTSFFYVEDKTSGKKIEISNCDYLTPMQEKMMCTQPDMMLQYARIIKNDFEKKGMENFAVKADAFVTLNGGGSRRFVDSSIDLSSLKDDFKNKTWILPY